jgi:hypothetical protein
MKQTTVMLALGLIVPAAIAQDGAAGWVATWGASPMPAPAALHLDLNNQTVRMIVHTSVGGEEARVRLSNTFGRKSLVIGEAHLALRRSTGDIVPGSDRKLTFQGSATTAIAPGAIVASDPVRLHAPALSDLAVSLYLPSPTGPPTFHSLSLSAS